MKHVFTLTVILTKTIILVSSRIMVNVLFTNYLYTTHVIIFVFPSKYLKFESTQLLFLLTFGVTGPPPSQVSTN